MRNWPSDDEINDAVRIAYENANAFADLLQMKKQLKNSSADSLIPEFTETNMNNNQLENEKISQNVIIEQVADELNRVSQLDNLLDNYFDVSDDLNSELNHDDESEDLLKISENFTEKTEINYIINNPKSNISGESNYEQEEKIFRNDGSCDIFLILELRKFHEAFSRSDRPRGIKNRIAINLDQGSQDKIDRNLANHLVNQLNNNQGHQIIRSRTQRWKGRNQIQSLVNSNQMQGKILI